MVGAGDRRRKPEPSAGTRRQDWASRPHDRLRPDGHGVRSPPRAAVRDRCGRWSLLRWSAAGCLSPAGTAPMRRRPGSHRASQPASPARVQPSSTSEVDGESVRTSQQLVFDDDCLADHARASRNDRPTSASCRLRRRDQRHRDLGSGRAGSACHRRLSASATGSITDRPRSTLRRRSRSSYIANGAVVRTEPSSAHRAKAW